MEETPTVEAGNMIAKCRGGVRFWAPFVSAIAAAISSAVAMLALYKTIQIAADSRRITETTTQADIAVVGARFDTPPEAGKNVALRILFENVGGVTAEDFVHVPIGHSDVFDVVPDAAGMPFIHGQSTNWPRIEECKIDPLIFGGRRPIYRGVTNEAIFYIFNLGPLLPQKVIDGRGSFFVTGCMAYRTLGKTRTSPYCLYLQPKRGKPIMDSSFDWCPSGSGNPR